MDEKLTKKIEAWLELTEPAPGDIADGAMLLLRLNRNRALYNNIMSRPKRYTEKLRYELRKFLRIRQDGKTMADVAAMERQVLTEVGAAITTVQPAPVEGETVMRKGRRADHDTLPDEVKALWDNNAERWKKIKDLYNTCLSLSQPCDRYEFLVQLREAWKSYRADMVHYDNYTLVEGTGDTNGKKEMTAAELAKAIGNARSYISKNLPRLVAMKGDEELDADFDTLQEKIHERVDILVENSQEIGEELRSQLADVGILLESDSDGAGQEGQ